MTDHGDLPYLAHIDEAAKGVDMANSLRPKAVISEVTHGCEGR